VRRRAVLAVLVGHGEGGLTTGSAPTCRVLVGTPLGITADFH
jgi:hypothetical protein